MNPSSPGPRLDYLDAVRAFALLLGIVFHAGLSFLPVFIGWAVMDVSTSASVGVFALVSHSFRMELFFLIAGFLSHMTYHRGGAAAFCRSRVVRIGVPLVVGWFVLRPLIVSGWVMDGQSLRGDVDIAGGLVEGFRSLAMLPTGLFVGTHLWFLYYLLLITALIIVLRFLLMHLPVVGPAMRSGFDRVTAWVAESPFGIVSLAVPTAVCLWFMDGWGMDTPDKSLAPHWPVLAVYTLCFGLGWLLHRQASLMDAFSRLTAGRVALCLVSVLTSVLLASFQQDPGHPHIDLLRLAFVGSYALMMWSLVVVCIGLFKRFFDRPYPVVRYLADASYWLYLIHLPVVVWLQIAVAEMPLNWYVKWLAVVGITVALGLVIYDGMVRHTAIGALLNGRRKTPALAALRARRTAGQRPGAKSPNPMGVNVPHPCPVRRTAPGSGGRPGPVQDDTSTR